MKPLLLGGYNNFERSEIGFSYPNLAVLKEYFEGDVIPFSKDIISLDMFLFINLVSLVAKSKTTDVSKIYLCLRRVTIAWFIVNLK